MIRVLVVTADDIKVKKYLVLTYTFDLICEVTIPFSFSFFHYFVSLFLKYHFETSKKYYTAQKNEFLFKDFFIKCDQIRRILQIWSHLLKKSLIENFIFMQCKILTVWAKYKGVFRIMLNIYDGTFSQKVSS